ncbi:hypothetical protein AHiyo8_51700 [Arthrobacter sp. Hiyo8]|nr:hypothetical protein AHiyo8_51700 [Arthrobacter sp. Hiyo8]
MASATTLVGVQFTGTSTSPSRTATKVSPGASLNHLLRAASSVVSRSQVKVSPARITGSRTAQIPGQSLARAARIS